MDLRLAWSLATWASVWAWLLVGSTWAGAITVWKPIPFAPQVVMQDDASGRVFYSRCNSNATTIFPNDVSYALEFEKRMLPRRNTRLASVGWSSEGDWGAIQYQTKEGFIVHSLWLCNATGHLAPQGQWIVSNIVPSINYDSGLASVILGREEGFRIYYQDWPKSTCAMSYSVKQGVWKYDGVISHDSAQGSAISATWTTAEKIHLAMPRQNGIEVARLHNNATWNLTTFPTPLNNVVDLSNGSSATLSVPTDSTNSTDLSLNTTATAPWSLDAWDGKASSIGYTIDTEGSSSIFYIGTDYRIHQVKQDVAGSWRKVANQSASVWPPALNSGNTDFGSAYDNKTGEVWLYYMSGGNMTVAYRSSNYEWQPAESVLKLNATEIELAAAQDGQNGGMTTQAKIGLGAGVGLGAVAMAGFLALVLILRRRRALVKAQKWQEQQEATEKNMSEHTSVDSPVSTRDGNWYSGSASECWVPEAHSHPVHEMDEQARTHELHAHARDPQSGRQAKS